MPIRNARSLEWLRRVSLGLCVSMLASCDGGAPPESAGGSGAGEHGSQAALVRSVGAVPVEEENRVASILASGIERGYPAVSIWVRRGAARPWSAADGIAVLETGEPATVDHAFHLASVTKLFTTVALLQLVDAGELTLDDPVGRWLGPEVVGELPHVDRMVVRHLLDHTSGLYGTNNDPSYIRAWLGADAPAAWSWTPQDFIDLAAQQEPWGEPGEAVRYGDLNTILVGRIVEEVTGRTLRERVAERLFRPLDLSSAYYFSDVPPGEATPVATVNGYLRLSPDFLGLIDVGKFPSPADGILNTTLAGERIDAAAAIVATAADLGRFGDALFRGDLLSAESRAWLLAVADELVDAPEGAEAQGALYAYKTRHGILLTAEGDGPGGSHTLLAYHPESDTIVVGLVNGFGFGDEAEYLLDTVVGGLLDRPDR